MIDQPSNLSFEPQSAVGGDMMSTLFGRFALMKFGDSELNLDDLRTLHSNAKAIARTAREFVGAVELAIVEHIETTKTNIPLDDGKYWYVGREKQTTVIDGSGQAIVTALLMASGGDISPLTMGEGGCLAANAFKPGACRATLNNDSIYDSLFTTVFKTDLKTGSSVKKLKIADPQFQPQTEKDNTHG